MSNNDLLASARRALKTALSADNLSKAEVGTKPSGRRIADKAAAAPPSIAGVPAPGNTAGPGRPAADDAATLPNKTKVNGNTKTVPKAAGVASSEEVMYLPKKDFPKAPQGTIGSTPNSWKVPAGLGRQLQAKSDNAEPVGTSPEDLAAFAKNNKPREVVIAHLKDGEVASKVRMAGDNVSETFKVVIQGNGAGIMKPPISMFVSKSTEVSKTYPDGQGPGWKYDAGRDSWVKETVEEIDPYHPLMVGAGSGNLPFKKQVQREVAGYNVSMLHGLSEVPVTVSRNEDGVDHSVQQWMEGFMDVDSMFKETDMDKSGMKKDIDVLHALVPREKHAELDQQLMDIAVFDIVANNQDRHGHNFLVNKQGKVKLIDHGMAFGNSMHGNRNHFLHGMFHKNKPIKVSATAQKRLQNLSFNDYKRAMPGMYDWESGQAFLRNRYVLWLQDNHGGIDRQKFLNTIGSNDGSIHTSGDSSNWSFAGENRISQVNEFEKREKAGMLPHQLFESWSKAFLEQAASDPTHRDHEDAKTLNNTGVFMERGFASKLGEDFYRRSGNHKKYEDTIKPSFDIPKNIGEYMNSRQHESSSESSDSTFQPGAGTSTVVPGTEDPDRTRR